MTEKDASLLHGDRPAAITAEAIADRKELAATAFQRTRMPMVVTDATREDHPIVLANEAFLKLTGYGASEVLGRNCRFLQGPATSAAAVAEIRAGLQEQREVSVEVLNYRKDGSAFWNQLHLSPIHDDTGRLVYHFGSQIDRTEYRRIQALEASEHRLLLEVDHRANNVLALVDSIVRLTKSENTALYAASVQKRVQSLARAHSLLSQRGWEKVPLRDTIQTQLEPYGASRAILSGPEFCWPHTPSSRSPCSSMNSQSTPRPMARCLETRAEWQSAGKTFLRTMAFTSCGKKPEVRPPPPVRRPGFGTMIAEATVRRQLHGIANREWAEKGVTVVVEVPNVTVDH